MSRHGVDEHTASLTADPGRDRPAPSTKVHAMTIVGFHASHEQLAPSAALAAVKRATGAGFGAAMCSDHYAPWSERQGQSGFAWSWLGAAMEATDVTFGVVNAPGQRYHPVIVAQAIATLGEMYPGRFWAALGSGQAMNEHITGERWPAKHVRDARLLECVEIVRALLDGEEVDHDGLVRVDRARLWSRPDQPPALVGAAVSAETAARVGGWADGLITINQSLDVLKEVIGSFREGGGGDKPVYVQVHLSWAQDEDTALELAFDQWRSNVFGSDLNWNLEMVAQFDALSEKVRPDDVRGPVLISAELDWHVEQLVAIAELGVDGLYLHHVGQEQEAFIDAFAAEVLPQLASAPEPRR
jgi:probable non-F420 flavinoid oxidoreductase